MARSGSVREDSAWRRLRGALRPLTQGPPDISPDERTRLQYYSVFVILGLPAMLAYGILNFVQGHWVLCGFILAAGLGLGFGWWHLRRVTDGRLVYRVNSALFGLLVLYMLQAGGEAGSKSLWMYTYPLIVFFLFGKKEGLFWSGSLFLAGLVLFWKPVPWFPAYEYAGEFKLRMATTYLIVSSISWWFEYSRHLYRIDNVELERRVEERTSELQSVNRRLERANEEALRMASESRAANRSKSEFLANMSHEIRTPLNGVIGFAEMLEDTGLDEVQQEYVETVRRSGNTLLSLINDILDFSKIEAGKMEMEAIDFDPEILAFDVCDLVAPKIMDKPVELICRIEDDLPAQIHGDPARFKQVLTNLVSNAAKFTVAGEVEVSVGVDQIEDGKILVHSVVRDTGIGISADKLEDIFTPFKQADGSTTREFGGTGLGLSICKKIAGLMGGDVWAESHLGEGSRFHFTAWVQASAEGKPPLDYSHTRVQGKKALVIEDNATSLALLTQYLAQMKMRVSSLQDAGTAVDDLIAAAAQGDPFDICICDIQLPEISAFKIAETIRKTPGPVGETSLLALSSMARRDAKRCEAAGFDGFIGKPVLRQKLYRMVQRLLGAETASSGQRPIATQYSIREELKRAAHILLVEDNRVNQRLAQIMLTKGGYHVQVVEDGQQALDLYVENPDAFDLIFMDMQMPVMDGLTATEKIRDWESSSAHHDSEHPRRIPIVAMTANALTGDREKCLAAGMDDYVAKPIKRDTVYRVLSKWVIEVP